MHGREPSTLAYHATPMRDVGMRQGARLRASRLARWGFEPPISTKARGHFFLEPEVHEHTRVGMSLIGG